MFNFLLIILAVFILLGARTTISQDERFMYKLLDKRVAQDKNPTPYKWHHKSKVYKLDLDRDGAKEGIVVTVKDHETWFNIYEGSLKVFEYKIDATGIGHRLYRVRLKSLSNSVVVIVLSFYEGKSEYLTFNSVSRYYFGAIKNGDLRKIKMIRGPHFWEESKNFNGGYEQHQYHLDFYDYNGDGIKDLAVKNRLISRVYSYRVVDNNSSEDYWVAY